MRQNAYIIANIGIDTAENEPSENADLVVGTCTEKMNVLDAP